MRNLQRLFHPRGVAVIGASTNPVRIGGAPVMALSQYGFKGRIYPVNPKYADIDGLRCYDDVSEIEGPCDLAVLAVPAKATAAALRACGEKGIPFAVVLSGGYRETGADGAALEADLKSALAEGGLRMVGPNCQGVINLHDRMYATFGAIANEPDMRTGPVSMVFQSGGFGFTITLLCEENGIGFRYLVSSGNETDLTTPEIIDAYLDDPQTKIAFALIEGVADGRALQDAGRKGVALGKPVIVWKIGNSETGARAAASHTANMTGSYDIYRAAFRQAGILEVQDVEQLRDLFAVFGAGRLPEGDGVAVISITGGSGIAFADRAAVGGMRLPDLGEATTGALQDVVPVFGSVRNPVDVTANLFNQVESFTNTVELVLNDPAVDQLCLLMASVGGKIAAEAARAIVEAAAPSDKPVVIAWSARRHSAEEAYRIFEEAGIPIVPTPVRAADAAAALWRFAQAWLRVPGELSPPSQQAPSAKPDLLPDAATLDERASKEWLAACGIPVTQDRLVRPGENPANALKGLRFPLVVKLLSPDIAHKSDVGGVRVNIRDDGALREAMAGIIADVRRAQPKARIEGILVSEMATGQETLVGVVNDAVFGPTVAFGLGGVFAEVLRDITYRVAPFDAATARAMIAELRGRAVFDGVRGSAPLDVDALGELLAAVSRFAWDNRDRIAELDINPLFVGRQGKGVVAADALIVLKQGAG
jgi:acyl-CoA synthetase (NDP forming)